jgi:hypothetical protein
VLDKDRALQRQGEVLSKDPNNSYRVRWEDGTEEGEIRLGRRSGTEYVLVPMNGLRHLGFATPAVLTELLESRPVTLFLAALSESEKPQTGADLTRRVSSIIAGEVGAAWKSARAEFEASDSVSASVQSPKRYRWTGPRDGDLLPAALPLTLGTGAVSSGAEQAGESATGLSTDPESARSSTKPQVSEAASDEHAQPSNSAGPSADITEDESSVSKERSLADVVKSARHALQGAVDDPGRELLERESHSSVPPIRFVAALAIDVPGAIDLAEMARTPLASSVALAELPDDILSVALTRLGAQFLPTIAALPRKSKIPALSALSDSLGDEHVVPLLLRAHAELSASKSSSATSAPLRKAYAHLVKRAVTASTVTVEVALRVLSGLDAKTLDPELTESAVVWLGTAIRRSGAEGWAALSSHDRSTLEMWAQRSPLAPDRARAQLLSAVHDVAGSNVAEPGWWRDVTWDEIAASAAGSMVRVVTSSAVRDLVVRPRAVEALKSASSRARLLTILAAPATLADAIDPPDVAVAIAGVRARDARLSGWVAAIADEAGREELDTSLRAAEMAVALAMEAREAAEARARAAFERGLRLEQEVAAARESTGELRASQERQVRIDALRALSDVAAFVDGALDRQSSDYIRGRVSALLGRQGVRALGEVGAIVSFDSDHHDLVGAPADPGQPIRVIRMGYTWDTPGGTVVLTRALAEKA